MYRHTNNSVWRKVLGENPRLAWLFLVLIAFFLTFPLLAESAAGILFLDLLLFAMLIFSAYAVSRNRTVLTIAVVLALPTMGFWVSAQTTDSAPLGFAGLAFSATFFLYVVIVLLGEVLDSETVDADTIYGAMSAYLLVGITWSFFYAMVNLAVPNAFVFGSFATHAEIDPILGGLRFFVYYSLVTLSTLGYGDITPLAPMARSLASLEAVIGQLYIAVLVAQLVGTRIAQRQSN